jgi:hypothetical protein
MTKMPYQKKRGLNRKPITRICIRIYDEQDAEELDKAFKSSVVQTQNDFFLGLILKAVREPSAPNQGSVDENPSDKAGIKKKLDDIEREVLDSGIAAKALGEKTEEQLLEALAIGFCIYNMTICIGKDKFPQSVVEKGLFDSEPQRFRDKGKGKR